MRVLVTGGAGYIGSHTVKVLRDRGDHVVVLDSLELGHRQSIGDTPLYVGNTKDRALIAQVVAEHKIDSAIHFAAYKAAGESMANPGKYFDNNVMGTISLLEALCQAGVRRLVFSSTAAVYGTPRSPPVRETDAILPENPYGESKRMVEQALTWYDACHQLRSISLRYFNAAGAMPDGSMGEDPRQAQNLIPIVMNVATGRRAGFKIFGDDYPTPDGTAVRDYVHVLDLGDAHARALDYLAKNDRSDVFNLGTGRGASVAEVLAAARRVTGHAIPSELSHRRPGDPAAVWADNSKARETLAWRPRYGLEDIIEHAWRWHATHPDGY
jgi:UDP-glucose 4-epimerase